MDTDTKEEKPKTRKVKKQVRKGELTIVSATASLDPAAKQTAAEAEAGMFMEDKLVADTEEKKNELETYIYEMRNKIDDQYAEFASEAEKEKLKAKLEAVEVYRVTHPHLNLTFETFLKLCIGLALR
jgi:heat shock protein 4